MKTEKEVLRLIVQGHHIICIQTQVQRASYTIAKRKWKNTTKRFIPSPFCFHRMFFTIIRCEKKKISLFILR